MRERGQTIPFWAFATLGMLALALTVLNYGSQLYWNVRAQNAADSAAAASVAVQTNIWNEESTILYATAVDEYRLRSLNQAVLNTLNQNGGCITSSTTASNSCNQMFIVLKAAYNQAQQNFQKDVALLAQADQFTQGGQNAQANDAKQVVGTCSNGNGNGGGGGNGNGNGNVKGTSNAIDPAFCYTIVIGNDGSNPLQPHTAAVIACRNVSYVGRSLINLTASTFQGVASSASAISTASSQAATVSAFQNPVEVSWYGKTPTLPPLPANAAIDKPYDVNFSNLTVNVNWYTSTPLKATLVSGFAPASYACQNG